MEERPQVHSIPKNALIGQGTAVCEQQVDLVLFPRKPLDVAFAILVAFKLLVLLSILLEPVFVIQNALRLEDVLHVLSHVRHHGVI